MMKLLEVVRGPQTSDASYNTLIQWGQSVGKHTVKAKDTPGFIVNRLLVPDICEVNSLSSCQGLGSTRIVPLLTSQSPLERRCPKLYHPLKTPTFWHPALRALSLTLS